MSLYAVVLLKVGGRGCVCEKFSKFCHGELASLIMKAINKFNLILMKDHDKRCIGSFQLKSLQDENSSLVKKKFDVKSISSHIYLHTTRYL